MYSLSQVTICTVVYIFVFKASVCFSVIPLPNQYGGVGSIPDLKYSLPIPKSHSDILYGYLYKLIVMFKLCKVVCLIHSTESKRED